MVEQQYRGLISALGALLAEPAPNNTTTQGLNFKSGLVGLAMATCYDTPPWKYNTTEQLGRKR
jgi:hypothetical protein